MTASSLQNPKQPAQKAENEEGYMVRGRARRVGSIFKRGNIWWVGYSFEGRSMRESSHSDWKIVAERLLAVRLAAVQAHREASWSQLPVSPKSSRPL